MARGIVYTIIFMVICVYFPGFVKGCANGVVDASKTIGTIGIIAVKNGINGQDSGKIKEKVDTGKEIIADVSKDVQDYSEKKVKKAEKVVKETKEKSKDILDTGKAKIHKLTE